MTFHMNESMNEYFIYESATQKNLASHKVTYETLVIQTYVHVHILKYENILISASN